MTWACLGDDVHFFFCVVYDLGVGHGASLGCNIPVSSHPCHPYPVFDDTRTELASILPIPKFADD